jgi:hypothetical protein
MARRGLLVQTERLESFRDGCRDRRKTALSPDLPQNGTKKGAAERRRLKVDKQGGVKQSDRSHSMSMKMDA